MRRYLLLAFILMILAGASLLIPRIRSQVRGLVQREPPAQITPLAVSLPSTATTTVVEVVLTATQAPTTMPPSPTLFASATLVASPTSASIEVIDEPSPAATESTHDEPTLSAAIPIRTVVPTQIPTAEPELPTASPVPASVAVNGRVYDAYIPAASKEQQAYQYSCEFDAAWVILQTYGFEVNVDQLIGIVGVDTSIEPYIEETPNGYIIHGGDIVNSFSGDYTKNYLARSSATAFRKAFEHYGLGTTLVRDREGVEAALLRGELVWIKTTVDFKPWRPAIWHMPDGSTYTTVLGNDHAVVVMGYNAESVVIRDVLGPTSTNRQRPYEYEVSWDTFMAAWSAQSFDGLAVRPRLQP